MFRHTPFDATRPHRALRLQASILTTASPFKNFTSIRWRGQVKPHRCHLICAGRGTELYRGRRLVDRRTGRMDGDAYEYEDEEGEGEGTAKKAWVLAAYVDAQGKGWKFQRT